MNVEYDYLDSRRPPENFTVEFETPDDVKAILKFWLERELNEGRIRTHQFASAGVMIQYRNRQER